MLPAAIDHLVSESYRGHMPFELLPPLSPARLLAADGYQQLALKWVFEMNGGLATEADYPYIGVTNFCNTTGPMVEFKKVRSI